jgi:hypothetical protein
MSSAAPTLADFLAVPKNAMALGASLPLIQAFLSSGYVEGARIDAVVSYGISTALLPEGTTVPNAGAQMAGMTGPFGPFQYIVYGLSFLGIMTGIPFSPGAPYVWIPPLLVGLTL